MGTVWHKLRTIYNLEDKVDFDGEGIVMNSMIFLDGSSVN
jgi:hypothetical protein